MRDILRKEMKLSASVLSYLFILFGLMFFLPGYPILCGAFFVSLGLFQSFQTAREANDIVFSVLLPIAKSDVVKAKYLFVCLIQSCALLLMAAAVVFRMTIFLHSDVYRTNALMNANFFALGMACLIFGLFNWIFVCGFFKTAYKFARPFVVFIIAAFLTVFAAEALHHVPGLEILNAFGTENIVMQLMLLTAGVILYLMMTILSCRRACMYFERIDL